MISRREQASRGCANEKQYPSSHCNERGSIPWRGSICEVIQYLSVKVGGPPKGKSQRLTIFRGASKQRRATPSRLLMYPQGEGSFLISAMPLPGVLL